MSDLTDAKRAEIKAALAEFERRSAVVEEEMKPLQARLVPSQKRLDEIEGEREAYLEQFEDDIAGKCETCGKLLFVGEPGQRPHDDDPGIIYCALHGMTFADVLEAWRGAGELDEYQMKDRDNARKSVDDHVANGGLLSDIMPGVV